MSNEQVPDQSAAARAARLRKEIERIGAKAPEAGSPQAGTPTGEEPASPPSPRDLIRERMRDLDRKT